MYNEVYLIFIMHKEALNLMKFWKRMIAAATTLCLMLSCFACGENTGIAMTIDGFDVRAGIYLYYVVNAYNDAISVMQENGEKFEDCKTTKDIKKIVNKVDINGVTAEQWIQNKAVEYCIEYVAIEREFDRLGLKLSGQDLADIDASLANTMTYFKAFFDETGIGEQSAKDVLTATMKENAIWEAYYGEGGSEGVKEEELYDFYKDNTLRLKYIEMPLKDGAGNLLKADGKAEIEKMAKDYMSRLEKKADDEADLMEEFDYLIEEHNAYVTSLSNAAVTTTDKNGSTVTTATTAKVTTDENGPTTTTTTTTTTASSASETTTTLTGSDETTGTTTTTTTAVTLGYDVDHEVTLAVSTSADADAEKEEADGTTTAPSYTPCQKVYEWAVDAKTKYNKPTLIKDDECYYIVMKMDIEDRMISSDLWSDSAKETVREKLYGDVFDEKIVEWTKQYTETRNEKAFKRYKVLNVDVVGYQEALLQSYYGFYGM